VSESSEDSPWVTKHVQAIARREPLAPDAIGQDLGIVAVPDRIGQAVPKQQETGLEDDFTLPPAIDCKTPGRLDAVSARRNVKARPDLHIRRF
jgi:hypothetical protein